MESFFMGKKNCSDFSRKRNVLFKLYLTLLPSCKFREMEDLTHRNAESFRLEKTFNITESQNHRIVGVGRDLCGSSSPT